jgi:hypothetical protein
MDRSESTSVEGVGTSVELQPSTVTPPLAIRNGQEEQRTIPVLGYVIVTTQTLSLNLIATTTATTELTWENNQKLGSYKKEERPV